MTAAYGGALLALELAALVIIAAHDVRTLRAPNRLVYPAVAVALVAVVPLGIGAATAAWLGALTSFGVLLAVALAGRGAMGLADTKVGALAGAVVGVGGVTTMLVATFVAGAVLAVVLLACGRRSRRDATAFTPFLLAGVLVTIALHGSSFPVEP